MDPVRNPYVPGAGRRPAALVGRNDTIEAWQVSLRRAERGITDAPYVLYGLRGVGKTVLLTRLRTDAASRDWVVVQVEARSERSLRETLGEGLYGPLLNVKSPSRGKKLLRALATAISFKASYDATGNWNFGLDLSDFNGGANTGILATDLKTLIHDLSAAMEERHLGVAILIDEAQDLEESELATLAAVAQAAAQDNWPVLFALAGLPRLPQTLAEAKYYSERFQFKHIERLSESDAKDAIRFPAQNENVEWSPEALQKVVQASGRYPYFIQQFGQEAWAAADSSPISGRDAEIGILRGQNQLDNGFFRTRWDRTTRAEKEYLRAMCPEGEIAIGSSEIARRLHKTLKTLGPVRARLIHKGLLFSPDHGELAFTVPGMADFIRRQLNED